jgi:hypothetical protein
MNILENKKKTAPTSFIPWNGKAPMWLELELHKESAHDEW